MKQSYILTFETGKKIYLQLLGRASWALNELIKAGKKGCTPINQPAPRWSAYVHVLRHEYGLIIETIYEPHGGPFPGTHARYVLKSNVTPA